MCKVVVARFRGRAKSDTENLDATLAEGTLYYYGSAVYSTVRCASATSYEVINRKKVHKLLKNG